MENDKNWEISRFEEQGDSLFICLVSKNNPVYIEHFWSAEEKLDITGTIETLVAELELMDEAYVAPLPRISRLEEAKAITISKEKVAEAKAEIVAEKAEVARIETERLEAIEEAKLEQLPVEEVIK